MAADAASDPRHPYHPRTLQLDHYVENDLPLPIVFTYLFAGLALVWGSTLALRSRLHPGLSRLDTACALWFATCASLHLFFEGHYVLRHSTIAAENSVLSQLWKEYAKSDSRYVSGDLQLLAIELITVVSIFSRVI